MLKGRPTWDNGSIGVEAELIGEPVRVFVLVVLLASFVSLTAVSLRRSLTGPFFVVVALDRVRLLVPNATEAISVSELLIVAGNALAVRVRRTAQPVLRNEMGYVGLANAHTT